MDARLPRSTLKAARRPGESAEQGPELHLAAQPPQQSLSVGLAGDTMTLDHRRALQGFVWNVSESG